MNPQEFDLKELEALIAAEPNNLDTLLALAEAYEDTGQWQDAIRTCKLALSLKESADADICNRLGMLYQEIDAPDLSEQYYLKALELHPGHIDALLNLGYLYKDRERFSEALLVLQWSLGQTNLGNNTHSEAMRMISDILHEQGDKIQPSKWMKITETTGLMAAEVTAARLRSEGILAWAWQEGVGQAYGLSIGSLGAGHVVVMEKDAEEANAILSRVEDVDDATALAEPYSPPDASPLAKAILGVTSVVFNPIGTGLAFLLSQLLGEKPVVHCPHCDTELELDAVEAKQGWYICIECGERVSLGNQV